MVNPQSAVSEPNSGWKVVGSLTFVRNGMAGIS